MSETKATAVPALVIKCGSIDAYSIDLTHEFTARFTFIVDDHPHDDNRDCNEGRTTSYGRGCSDKMDDLQDFVFHCYLKPDGTHLGDGPQFAFSSRASMLEIERAARATVRLQRGLNKLNESRGYPADMGDWFGRCAEVLGIKLFLELRDSQDRRQGNYPYRSFNTVGDVVNRVRCMVSDIKTATAERELANV